MAGFYHVLNDPGQSAALDGQPDPPDDPADATLAAAQRLARKRRKKFRAVLTGGGAFHPQPLDELGGRWRKDGGMILIETVDAVADAAVPAYVRPLLMLTNQTAAQILAYIAANSAQWQ